MISVGFFSNKIGTRLKICQISNQPASIQNLHSFKQTSCGEITELTERRILGDAFLAIFQREAEFGQLHVTSRPI